MVRNLLLTLFLCLFGTAYVVAQTSLSGQVTNLDSGETLPFATVALYKGGVLITGTETDFDGNYSFSSIDAGTYNVEFSYVGFGTQTISNVNVIDNKLNKLDVEMSEGENLKEVVITYQKPLVEQDNTSQGQTITSEEIQNLPVKNINAIAASTAGVATSDTGGDLKIRGSRSNSTDYYIDGIRVNSALIPQTEIEQLQVITGGIEARYGDVTGGIVSITTKGPSSKFRGGLELETSEPFNEYGYNLLNANISGPLIKSKTKRNESILGFRLAAQYLIRDEDDPPALPIYRLNDERLAELQANPIIDFNGSPANAAEFINDSDVVRETFRTNSGSERLDLTGKLDARLTDDIDVTLTGSYRNSENLFLPSAASALFNSEFNPTNFNNQYRGNFRFRHRVGNRGSLSEGGERSGISVTNAVYILQFGYEKNMNESFDPRHEDRFFDYGYIGNFDFTWEPTFDFSLNQEGQLEATNTDYLRTFQGYSAGAANPILANYNLFAGDSQNFNDYIATNGFISSIYTSTFGGFFSNVGTVYNSYSRSSNEQTTFLANASFQLVPKNPKNKHTIQFGIQYEQQTDRAWAIAPFSLWNAGRQLANRHITGVDTTNVIGQEEIFGPGGQVVVADIYGNLIEEEGDQLFYRRLRDVTGDALNEYANIDGLDPSQLSLDMFSAKELNDQGLLSYFGYDYLGENEIDVTFNEFFSSTNADGIRDFPVAPFRPIYAAGFIQDKFTFSDVIFRVGLRVDYFDANTQVLKDPYALYEIRGAADFHSQFGGSRPGNIGDDFKVYTEGEEGETVRAYRDGDQWYFPNGQPANDGTEIFGGEIAFPSYTNPDANIQGRDFDPSISFEDYEPQINWMPRLAFSFPISDQANFFAHYDVLVERPQSNNQVTPLTYYYFEETTGIRNNANLKPQTTVDYEVGFQQLLSENSALKISAYYKELRDLIQARFYQNVPAPINTYQTYDNIDFGTVKGFSLGYDLRRTGNVQLNATYTLQFADGTGSDANSSRNLGSRSIQRTLYPLSFDERHRFNLVLDYRYGEGEQYNGPRIGGNDFLANFGINIQSSAVSGLPYTASTTPEIRGGSGTVGSINGARLPWNFFVNAQADKNFRLNAGGENGRAVNLNVYLRVSNLLDRRNIIGVYSATGSPTDDGYLATSRGAGQIQGIINAGRSADTFLSSYQYRLLNPNFFSLPRQMFLGAIVNF